MPLQCHARNTPNNLTSPPREHPSSGRKLILFCFKFVLILLMWGVKQCRRMIRCKLFLSGAGVNQAQVRVCFLLFLFCFALGPVSHDPF